MTGFYTIKNWEKFQHYKDRNPPWIKLHRELLDDYDFSCLQDASKAHLMFIWLLASQLNNRIPNDPKWLKNKLGLTSPVDLKELEDKGFLILEQDASGALAKCSPETEEETEAEYINIPPSQVSENAWREFLKIRKKKKAQNTRYAIELIHTEIAKQVSAGFLPQALVEQSIRKSWTDIYPIQEKNNAKQTNDTKSDRAKAAVMRAAQAGGFAPGQPEQTGSSN